MNHIKSQSRNISPFNVQTIDNETIFMNYKCLHITSPGIFVFQCTSVDNDIRDYYFSYVIDNELKANLYTQLCNQDEGVS